MFRFKTWFFLFSKVHLSRAALYGAEGRYAKAVLDCNEAIRIQPKCVRAYLYKGALKFYLKVSKNSMILSIIISHLRLMLSVKFERNVVHLSSFFRHTRVQWRIWQWQSMLTAPVHLLTTTVPYVFRNCGIMTWWRCFFSCPYFSSAFSNQHCMRDHIYRNVYKCRMSFHHDCICILMHIYSRPPHYFSLIFKALRDYSITLLLDCKTELELKVLINRGLLYVELNDYSSALQVGRSYKEKEALIASGLWISIICLSKGLWKHSQWIMCEVFSYFCISFQSQHEIPFATYFYIHN